MNDDRNLTPAEQRARNLLAETELFDALGIDKLGFHARAVARDVLELTAELASERSARIAIQEARDRCLVILAQHAYEATAEPPRLAPILRLASSPEPAA